MGYTKSTSDAYLKLAKSLFAFHGRILTMLQCLVKWDGLDAGDDVTDFSTLTLNWDTANKCSVGQDN